MLRLKLYAVLAGALLFGALGLRASWMQAGAAKLRADMERKRLDAALQAKEIENEVEALDADALRARARKWVRKAPR